MNRYDQRLARAAYAMVLLAILAMVLGEGTPVYFALASLAALISWPIAHGRSGQSAVPRWLVSLAVLLALMFFLYELLGSVHLISALAHFMIFVQVCKFFETKKARDYGQLIVLSLLEMVVAAILSSSMAFALLLLTYLALSIYTLLLFHFKREMELFERGGARSVALAPGAFAAAAGTLDRLGHWRLWRISASTGAFTLIVGVALFLGFPRIGEGLLGRASRPDLNHLTGFTDTPRLGDIGRIKESDELVMWVTVLDGGRPVRAAGAAIMLRGVASWQYLANQGQWAPAVESGRGSREPFLLGDDSTPTILTRAAGWTQSRIRQQREIRIDLGPIDSGCLFVPYPALAISSDSRCSISYSHTDQTVSSRTRPATGLRYTVWTPRVPTAVPVPRPDKPFPNHLPAARKLAREWTASLADRAHMEKAQAICDRLQRDYRYTLQMLGPTDPTQSAEPLEVFLTQTKAGHCQYFASAMTVMCQELGIPARMISGFKACEFNPQGNYYIVRQKHAHSWVEVYVEGRGWVAYDPTPSAGDDSFDTPTGLVAWLTYTIDYMNYKWQQRVLNYSQHDRELLLSTTGGKVGRKWQGVKRWIGASRDWAGRHSTPLIGGVVFVGLLIFLRQRSWRRKAARRAQLAGPRGIGFWADLLRLLDRRRLTPPPALTPLEVAEHVAGLVPQVRGLPALASTYYEHRYGQRPLTDQQQSTAKATLAALAAALGRKRN